MLTSKRAYLFILLLGSCWSIPLQAGQPVHARKAMVVAQEPLAVDVGLRILHQGGNAVDAAVAVGFALAVTHPFAGNLGGGGFMLIRFADGRSTFVDFREKAPAKASRDMYLDAKGNVTDDSLIGWRASAVPGTVRGLELAGKKYGRLRWAKLLQPAIALAKNGYPVSYAMMQTLRDPQYHLAQFPESTRIFLKGGAYYDVGETFRQPELARTLERIAARGSADFYEGETARLLADAMAKNGGLITLQDLRRYRAIERKPLEGDYKGYHIVTSPPPSSGGVGLLEMLGILQGLDFVTPGAGSAREYHFLAEAMRRFYADRSEYLGDPDFVKNPVGRLLDPEHLARWRRTIDETHATPSELVKPGLKENLQEGSNTTHFNIVDEQGNAVAVTYTLNEGYGSGVTIPGAGFLMNDEMDDFAAKPGEPNLFELVQGEANAIAPGKRPLSSMTPTIVVKDGKPFLLLGAPGGSKIITGVLQVLLNVIDFNMNVQDAVDFPRVHHQWKPDRLDVEPGVSPDTAALLQGMGYDLRFFTSSGRPEEIGRVEAIEVKDGWLLGGHDRRGPGKAAGY